MDDHRWDDLTRSLARGVSRRTVLKGLVGAVMSGVLVKSETETADAHFFGPNSACTRWCAAVFGSGTVAAGKCSSDAARRRGLCRSCGTRVTPSSICCTRNAQGYCSSYSGATCCARGSGCCGATCTGLDTTSNCGACGHTCPTPANATATCSTNTAGQYQCGHTCGPDTCNIGDACYAVGAVNPANMCQHCDPANSTTAWTALTCAAPDQCHTAGVCNPATGVCTYAVKPNGTTCDDGNACTQADTCQDGVCVGGNPVVCTALDACHVAGVCDPTTGQCSNPNAADGTTCNDDNACTSGDTCQAGQCVGGTPTTCTPGPCQTGGTCDPATGDCSFTNQPDGTLCGADDTCTHDICQAGACVANVPKPDGTACSDDSSCTNGDACRQGVCLSGAPVTCPAADVCHAAGTCDSTTGTCSPPTLMSGFCFIAGACVASGVFDPHNTCKVCNPALSTSSYANAADGSACDDGNRCTQFDTCQAGQCVGGNPVVCTASDQCHVAGTCDPATGVCSNPDAADDTPCDDGNPATCNDVCLSGVCAGTNDGTCVPSCEPGYYLSTVSLGSTCRECPAGQYCPGDNSRIACPIGTANPDTGATACTPCPAGAYADVPASMFCSSCPSGSYSEGEGNASCTLCPGASSNSGGGTSIDSCTPCPPGTYAYHYTDATVCAPCPPGRYAGASGSSSCTACPPGTYAGGSGNTTCSACLPGTYAGASGSSTCAVCPAGTYAGGSGSTTCTSCGACGQCYACDRTSGCVMLPNIVTCDSGHGTCGDHCNFGTCESSGQGCECLGGQTQCGAGCCNSGCCQATVFGGVVNSYSCVC